MEVNENRTLLKESIKRYYKNFIKINGDNVYRGHVPSLCSVTENEVCYFIKNILGNEYIYYIDPTFSKNSDGFKNTIHPDIVITDRNNNLKYVIEVKSNSGWVRKIDNDYLQRLVKNNKLFAKNNKSIICKYMFEDKKEKYLTKSLDQIIVTNKDVKCFYVVLTSDNNSIENAVYNNNILKKNNIKSFVLFSGWYNELTELNDERIVNEKMSISDFENEFIN